MTGIKHDTGKPRMSLIPDGVLDEVLAVLEFGAQKYSPDNWHKLENAKTRYYDAAHRHIAADRRGEKTDEESGRHPLAHAIADLIFMLGLDLREDGGVESGPPLPKFEVGDRVINSLYGVGRVVAVGAFDKEPQYRIEFEVGTLWKSAPDIAPA